MANKSKDVKKISAVHLERLHELNTKIRASIDKVGTLELDLAVMQRRQDELQRESNSTKDGWFSTVKDRNEFAEELREKYGNDITIDQTTGEIADAPEVAN